MTDLVDKISAAAARVLPPSPDSICESPPPPAPPLRSIGALAVLLIMKRFITHSISCGQFVRSCFVAGAVVEGVGR